MEGGTEENLYSDKSDETREEIFCSGDSCRILLSKACEHKRRNDKDEKSQNPVAMINRAAVILTYKPPAVRWINDADPYNEDPGIALQSVNEDRTVYLIAEQDADDSEAFEKWLSNNYSALFEAELEGWYTDESLWPKNRDRKLFNEWFEVGCHSVIEDTVGLPIEDDET